MKKICYFVFFFCFRINLLYAASLIQKFDVEIGFFDASVVEAKYSISDAHYSFNTKIKTSGIFDSLYSFDAQYHTEGNIKEDKFLTKMYDQKTQSSSHIRTKKLIFDQNGAAVKRQSSKDAETKVVDIEKPDFNVDSHDIQTVLVMMIEKFRKEESCQLSKTIFNGKKTYEIRLQDVGKTLFQDEKVKISGTAHKCLAFIHQRDGKKGDLLWQTTGEKPISFYLMKDENTGLVFVPKIEILSTPLGKLEAYMTDLIIEE